MIFLVFILFPVPVSNLSVISPCNITIISRSTPFLLLIAVVHSGFCEIFYTLNNRLLGESFWNISCWYPIYLPIRTISFEFEINFQMALIPTRVTSYNWLGRWTYSRVIVFLIVEDSKINLLRSLSGLIFNFHSRRLQK